LLAHFDEVPGVGRSADLVRAGFKMLSAATDVAIPPPRLGEHTDAILAELGYTGEQVTELRRLVEYKQAAAKGLVSKGHTREHLEILEAIERGDRLQAAALMQRHLRASRHDAVKPELFVK
jgi:hypothetical protein